jgi:hypothetical protein
MPIVFFAANGNYIKNKTDWDTNLAIFERLATKIPASVYEIRLPDNKISEGIFGVRSCSRVPRLE